MTSLGPPGEEQKSVICIMYSHLDRVMLAVPQKNPQAKLANSISRSCESFISACTVGQHAFLEEHARRSKEGSGSTAENEAAILVQCSFMFLIYLLQECAKNDHVARICNCMQLITKNCCLLSVGYSWIFQYLL